MIQLLGAAANQTFEMPSIDYHQIAPILVVLGWPSCRCSWRHLFRAKHAAMSSWS